MLRLIIKITGLFVSMNLLLILTPLALGTQITTDIIAFEQDGNIYLGDAIYGISYQLTRSGRNSFPQWSPDGEQLIFVSFQGLYHSKTNGRDLTLLIDGINVDRPFWSPDGKYVAFTAPSTSPLFFDFETGEIEQIPHANTDLNKFLSGWSYDGQSLIFYELLGSGRSINVFQFDLTTQVIEPFSYISDFDNDLVFGRWSSDGTKIAALTFSERLPHLLDSVSGESIYNLPRNTFFTQWDGDDEFIYRRFNPNGSNDFYRHNLKTGEDTLLWADIEFIAVHPR